MHIQLISYSQKPLSSIGHPPNPLRCNHVHLAQELLVYSLRLDHNCPFSYADNTTLQYKFLPQKSGYPYQKCVQRVKRLRGGGSNHEPVLYLALYKKQSETKGTISHRALVCAIYNHWLIMKMLVQSQESEGVSRSYTLLIINSTEDISKHFRLLWFSITCADHVLAPRSD